MADASHPASVVQAVDPGTAVLAAELLYREADILDRQKWADWLGLYREDAVFWAPAWLDEHRTTADPDAEISLIYHVSRIELEERVLRIQSRKSITALPLPRTLHLIASPLILDATADRIEVQSCAAVHVYDPRTASHHVSAVRYRHRFERDEDRWLITSKSIVLINDRMPSVVDFYTL